MSVGTVRLALIGRTGAGKSEVARILSELCTCQIVKTGAICRKISKLLFGNEDKQSTQLLDDALTPIDASIFLKAALRDIDLNLPTIIDSLRFRSDLDLASRLGFRIVRVASSEHNRSQRLVERQQAFDIARDGLHRSETELDDATTFFTIINDGSREDLREQLKSELAAHLR